MRPSHPVRHLLQFIYSSEKPAPACYRFSPFLNGVRFGCDCVRSILGNAVHPGLPAALGRGVTGCDGSCCAAAPRLPATTAHAASGRPRPDSTAASATRDPPTQRRCAGGCHAACDSARQCPQCPTPDSAVTTSTQWVVRIPNAAHRELKDCDFPAAMTHKPNSLFLQIHGLPCHRNTPARGTRAGV